MKPFGQVVFFTLFFNLIVFPAFTFAQDGAHDSVIDGGQTPVGPSGGSPVPYVPPSGPTYLPAPWKGPAPPPSNTADVPLGNLSNRNFDEPLIRMNPTNSMNVVVTSHGRITTSVDGGLNYGAAVPFSNALGGSNGDTAMAFDSQGRLFWANLLNVSDGEIQVARVNPLTGATVTGPVDVQAASGDVIAGFDDKEFMAADEYIPSIYTDNLYLIWSKLGATNDVFYTRSTDQGVNWSTPLQLSAGAEGSFPWPSDIAVAPNGDVYAAYHSGGSSGAVGDTWVLRSTDGGVTFPQKNQAFLPGQSDLTFNVQSGIMAIPLTRFWTQGAVQPWVLPDPARPGQVYVVNNDDPDNTHGAGDDGDVVFARSTNNGMNWSFSTIPDGSGGAHQLFPFAAIDEQGNIAVAWYDTRRNLLNGFGRLMLDVFATYSTDGGQTWATAFMVNDPNNPFDPDFPSNQRRFPTPQITPCAKVEPADPANRETCRIGEYFGIDIQTGVVRVTWVGNTFDVGGNVTGDQQWIDSFGLPTDISISKSDSVDPVIAGNNLIYTVTVSNPGSVDAVNAIVTDTLPAGVTYVSDTASCNEAPLGTLSCTLALVPAGGNVQFTITVAVDSDLASGSNLSNSVSVAATNNDPDTDDNSATQLTNIITSADLLLLKTDSDDPAIAGTNLTYKLTVTNQGPSDALNVSVVDHLPPGVSYVSDDASCVHAPVGTLTCDIGTLADSTSQDIEVMVAISPSLVDDSVIENSAIVTSTTTDPNGLNNDALEQTTIIRQVNITMTKLESIEPVVAGTGASNLVYTITATNNGPSDVTGASFTEVLVLPVGVSGNGSNASAGVVGGMAPNLSWTGVNIPANSFATLTVNLTVGIQAPEGADLISDTATFTGSTGGEDILNPEDDAATESTGIRWPTARWTVYKEYTDDHAAPVNVDVVCSTGSGLGFGNPASADTTAMLEWRRFDIGSTDCSIVETVPSGYYELERTIDCDVNPVADIDAGGSYDCTLTNAPTIAWFNVTKEFTDGNNPTLVDITINCFTGLPITQSQTIDENGNVNFVVVSFNDEELDCDITEDLSGPDLNGYTPTYYPSGESPINGGVSNTLCAFENVGGGEQNDCYIENNADPVEIAITKNWIVTNRGGDVVDQRFKLTLYCDADIVGNGNDKSSYQHCGGNSSSKGLNGYQDCQKFLGDGDSLFTTTVIPQWPGSYCWVEETVYDDAVEIDNPCDGVGDDGLTISHGQGDSCLITNTVFFEGIPALSRLGMALLALLMLGAGLIGFRRFA